MLLAWAQESATFTVAGDWEVRVSAPGLREQTVRVTPPAMIAITAEPYTNVPIYNPKGGGWMRGFQLSGVKAQETTSPALLDTSSFVLRTGPQPDSPALVKGTDYEIDVYWGTFGRLEGGSIKPDQTVYATYKHAQKRLDAVIATSDGKVVLRQGSPHAAAPAPPQPGSNERHLGNIYLPGFITKLDSEHLFPILEYKYPEQPRVENSSVNRIVKRLKSGQPVRILAWGDSVTDGVYVPDRFNQRWQEQFVARLREKYPQAKIELVTQAWGGRNTNSYLNEPPGSPHNYRETVLGVKPDVVISEFVNDAGLKPAQVEERYSKLLADFKEIGAEWIILTPHYVRPDWMNLTRERDIDDDPRPYVQALRQFAATHDVALADASLRYGRLWRQGIPYNTLMLNAINHPNAFGLKLFADALMALFP